MLIKRIGIFCGSNPGNRGSYIAAAQSLATHLAERNIGIVYGGSNVGLMGALANAALRAGGEVIGVMPLFLVAKEIAHSGLTELRIVSSMHERKALMADLSDAFIALPGGLGTLDEFCEILTWTQLGLQRKRAAILNIDGYFDHLLQLFDHATMEGFVKPAHREMLIDGDHVETLIDRLLLAEPPFSVV
jgi:uncharacterized protein (TIGR00730 family)